MNRDDAVKELADVQEVLDCMAEALGVNESEIAKAQAAKRVKAGSFKDRLYVEIAEIADDDPWVEYYLSNPDRYPEEK